jgi:hypothetical protein
MEGKLTAHNVLNYETFVQWDTLKEQDVLKAREIGSQQLTDFWKQILVYYTPLYNQRENDQWVKKNKHNNR